MTNINGMDGSHRDASSPLRESLAVLRFRKWSIALATLVTVASALAFSYWQTPIYQSESKVLVKPLALSPTEPQTGAVPNLPTERELAESVAVAELAAQELGLDIPPDELLEGVDVDTAVDTEILVFKYAHPTPAGAQRRAQAFAEAYLEFRRGQFVSDVLLSSEAIQEEIAAVREELERVNNQIERADGDTSVLETRASSLMMQIALLEQELASVMSSQNLRVGEIVQPADLPTRPRWPNYYVNAMVGLLIGLALGVGLAFLRERLDESIRDRRDLEFHLGASVLAAIPKVAAWKKRDHAMLLTLRDPRSAASEAYRSLRTNILFASSVHGTKALLVTSAHPGEGKSTTTANLGVSLAQAGKRVVLVSGDLRRPRLHAFFGYVDRPGLSEVLAGEATLSEALMWPNIENLRLLPSGRIPGNPTELLSSQAMARLLVELRQSADFVLVDSAPVLAVADPIAMSPLCDAVLFVADARSATHSALAHAREELDKVHAHVIGAVLNEFDASKARAYGASYGQYYGYRQKRVEAEEAGPVIGR